MATTRDPAARRLLFACLRCGGFTPLPTCRLCHYEFETVDGIYQLTRDPDSKLDDGQGATYIGYDRIGAYYHGRHWAASACDASSMAVGAKVSELTARGTVLDVGCGGGIHAVPAALHGCTAARSSPATSPT